ncbi:MAG: AmmeMemoRadiSam system protein A [Halobacteriales archaeon]
MPGDSTPLDALDPAVGSTLVSFARETIEAAAAAGDRPETTLDPRDHPLSMHAGAFVTVERDDDLRGCMGRVEADDPLWQVVRTTGTEAARDDPRFPPVRPEEVADLTVDVTVLLPPTPVDVDDPVAYPDRIAVGRDGLILRDGRRQGLLLPQVAAERDWDAREFLEATARKAGLPGTAWRREGVTVERFTGRSFAERRPGGEVVQRRFKPVEPSPDGGHGDNEALVGGRDDDRPSGAADETGASAGERG